MYYVIYSIFAKHFRALIVLFPLPSLQVRKKDHPKQQIQPSKDFPSGEDIKLLRFQIIFGETRAAV